MLTIIAVTLAAAVAALCLTLKLTVWILLTAMAFSLLLQPLLFVAVLIAVGAISYFIYRHRNFICNKFSRFNFNHFKFNNHKRSHDHVIPKLPISRD